MAMDNKATTIGIHVGSDRITGIATRGAGAEARVLASASVDLPPGAIHEDGIDPGVAGPALRRLVRNLGVRATQAHLAVPIAGDHVRSLRLPDATGAERVTMVRGELEGLNLLPTGTGAFDAIWVPVPNSEGGRRQSDVSAYFLREHEIDSYEAAFDAAGLLIAGIEPKELAVVRGILAEERERPVAVLNVGEDASDLILTDGNQVRLARRIPGGIHDLVGATAPVPAGAGVAGAPAGLPDIPGFAMETAANDPMTNSFLVLETTRTFAFYLRDLPDAPPIEELILSGPGTVVAAQAALADAVGIPVRCARLQRLEPLVPSTTDTEWIGAYGAALGATPHGLPKLHIARNLRQSRSRRRAPIVVRMGIAASIVVLASAAFGRWTLGVSTEWAAEARGDEMKAVEQLRSSRAPAIQRRAIADQALGLKQAADIPVPQLLARLALATTPGVGIHRMELLPDGVVRIDGDAVSSRSVQAFAQAIGNGRELKGAFFEMMRQEPDGMVRFRISARYRAGNGGGA
ncbi:MAG: hypothetical protein ACKO5K_17330 [Armatimonadota bacterium]